MRTWIVVVGAILATFLIVLLTLIFWPSSDDEEDSAMGSGKTANNSDTSVAIIPPVDGYYADEEILFIHPEASDQQVVDMLGGMMGSPVILVPDLAAVPVETLGNVYVFTNGVTPEGAMGPLGFQPDVFDSAPGDENYSPLRAISRVTWLDEDSATVLTSMEAILSAEERGELTIEHTDLVVNMPFLTWPGGER